MCKIIFFSLFLFTKHVKTNNIYCNNFMAYVLSWLTMENKYDRFIMSYVSNHLFMFL